MDKKTVLAELVACLHGIEHDQKRIAETGCVMTTNAQTRKRIKAIEGAIEYIKAHEPVEPKIEETILSQKYNENMFKNYYCGNCGEFLHKVGRIDKFCSQCGRAVKWDG